MAITRSSRGGKAHNMAETAQSADDTDGSSDTDFVDPIDDEDPKEADDPDPEAQQNLLPFGFERPFGQPADEFSRTYTLKAPRHHLSIDERIQALLMEDLESYMNYGHRADPAASARQYIIWHECANEPRAAVCNDLSQMSFSMDIVRAVFAGQFAKGHSNRATGYFLYQHYPAVKKRVGQRKKRRRSSVAAAVREVSEATMEKIIELVVARTAPEVNALAERVAGHDLQLQANDQRLRDNEKQLKKHARRIEKHADRLATVDAKLTAIQNSGVETALGIGRLMEMMAAKV